MTRRRWTDVWPRLLVMAMVFIVALIAFVWIIHEASRNANAPGVPVPSSYHSVQVTGSPGSADIPGVNGGA